MENLSSDNLNPEESQKRKEKEKEKKKEKKTLQLERNRTSHERLMLSWVRTSLSLFVIGFTAFELYYARVTQGKEPILKLVNGRDIAVFLFSVTFTMLLLATIQHYKMMQKIKKLNPASRFSVAAILAFMILLLIGKLLFNAIISFY